MAKRAKSPTQIKAEIEKLNRELAQAEAREGERLGALAVKAGLHEIEASEPELVKALKELTARFRTAPKQSAQTA